MKLNRHISILLATLILVSNVGLAFNVHYCAGKISAVSMAYRQQEPVNNHHLVDSHNHGSARVCCKIKVDNHKKCCKDDVLKLEDKSDGKVIVKSLQLDLGTLCTVNEWKAAGLYTTTPLVTSNTPSFYCESHAPPLFKLYCRYILYA